MLRSVIVLAAILISGVVTVAQTESPKAVSATEASTHLLAHEEPITPPLAKAARVGGKVQIQIVISSEGNVIQTKLISGHPMLTPAAIRAVKTWKYKPFVENGASVAVATDVEIEFPGGMSQNEIDVRNRYFPIEDECRKLIHDGKFEDAEEKCRQAVELSNELPKEVVLERSIALTMLAHAIYMQGRVAEAIPLYENALALDRGYLKADDADLATDYANLGRAYAKTGELSKADTLFAISVTTFEAAIKSLPSMKENYTARLKKTLNEYAFLKQSAGQSKAADDLRNEAAALQ